MISFMSLIDMYGDSVVEEIEAVVRAIHGSGGDYILHREIVRRMRGERPLRKGVSSLLDEIESSGVDLAELDADLLRGGISS